METEKAHRLHFETKFAAGSLPDADERVLLAKKLASAHKALSLGNRAGSGMREWIDFPARYLGSEEYQRILQAAESIRRKAEVLLVIGIGGSYLGARAVIEAAGSRYYNELRKGKGTPAIYFTGNNISECDCAALDTIIEGKDFCINIISKSGTTLEPALAFRHFREKLEERYKGQGREADRRIFVTTDAETGALLDQAKKRRWKRFVVPRNMGGRYSVLSAVGLLPIACAGIDVEALLKGAAAAQLAYAEPDPRLMENPRCVKENPHIMEKNPCYWYAALRYHFYMQGRKSIEMFASYEPNMTLFGEWLKQLYGESEGKEFKGLFPAAAVFTTDLHSMGQYIQEGVRLLFETVVTFGKEVHGIGVKKKENDGDELNYLADNGWTLFDINAAAFHATALAHRKGGCPNLQIELPGMDAESMGWLIYFFEKACAISGYMIGVNPFDQPGVESYKNFMLGMLGKVDKPDDKPVYEDARRTLREDYGLTIAMPAKPPARAEVPGEEQG